MLFFHLYDQSFLFCVRFNQDLTLFANFIVFTFGRQDAPYYVNAFKTNTERGHSLWRMN